MILTFTLTLVFLLSSSNLLLLFALKKLFSRKDSNAGKSLNITIVIALKNEALNIKRLISSLELLDYPSDHYEVILIDDNSTDDTFCSLETLTAGKINFKVMKANDKVLPAKKGALNIGIDNARYEHIMITDADCRPSPGWLSAFSSKFQEGYEFLFGIVPFFTNEYIVNKISCYENFRSSILMFSFAELNQPYSATARSLGFRKESFRKIGGYTNTKDVISGDDDLLLRESVKHKLKIGTVTESDAFVYSQSKINLNDYLKQKSRHTSTSIHYLLKHKIFLAFWHILNLTSLPIFFAAFISPVLFIIPAVKFIFDFLMVAAFQKKFGYKFDLIDIVYFQCCYEVLLLVNFFNALRRKSDWT